MCVQSNMSEVVFEIICASVFWLNDMPLVITHSIRFRLLLLLSIACKSHHIRGDTNLSLLVVTIFVIIYKHSN